MKFLYKNLIQLGLIFLITITYFIIIEIITRGTLWVTTKDKNFLYYGFDKDILFQIVDLTDLKFNFENINDSNKSKEVEDNKKIVSNPKKTLWTFGASLTYGLSCGKDSSSWPNELQNINDNIEVFNFGFPSTYTNDSIKLLKYNLNSKDYRKPNYILWSHKIEEKLAIHRGLGNHKDKINKKASVKKSNVKFFILRVEKTFEANSVSYRIAKHMTKKLQKRFNLYDEKVKNARTDNDLDVAIENYKFNTIEAVQLAEDFGVDKFIIVSLVTQDELDKLENDYFISKFNETGKKLSANQKTEFINIFSIMSQEQRNNYQKYYCANKHYTLIGNVEIAKILNEQIF